MPLLVLVLAAGCSDDDESGAQDGGVDCSKYGPPAPFSFRVRLTTTEAQFPADLSLDLVGGGDDETVPLTQIQNQDPTPCWTESEVVVCQWGDGRAGPGSYDATASGYTPVHLALDATPAVCGGADPDYQEAAIEPQ